MNQSDALKMGNSCPNLPGYRSNQVNSDGPKKHGFTITHGVMNDPIEKPAPPKRQLLSSSKSQSLTNSMSLMSIPGSPVAKYIQNTNKVLSFDLFTKEAVNESADENYRVHKCKLYYYLEDDTIQISELKQENSGIPQGQLVKRQNIDVSYGNRLTINDIHVGEKITIYGRTYQICGCNRSTADWLLEERGFEVQQFGYPDDPYEELRKDHMLRETGADLSVARNALKNPMKKHMEATLGNTVNNSGRDGFMKYGRKCLRFDAMWDDSTKMYGDIQRYVIHYFMADDTMEVLEVAAPNSGRDPFPKLLSKQRLSKRWGTSDANGRPDESSSSEFYHWSDFQIGGSINVYSRDLVLVDADESTRKHFEAEGIELSDAIPVPTKDTAKVSVSEPAYNGWGSEEDSLASCRSLVPKPPKTQFDLEGANLSRQILRFQAEFEIPKVEEDKGRVFIIQFYMENNSISFNEPPQRNTGVIGGKFLERSIFTNPNTGKIYRANEFYVGAVVKVNGYVFKVTDVDEATLKFMEHRPKTFKMSDVHRVMDDLRKRLQDEGKNITDTFRAHDQDHSGNITIDEFKTMMMAYDENMVHAEVITLMRHFDKNGDGLINFEEFAHAVEGGQGLDARKHSDPWIVFGESTNKSDYQTLAEKAAVDDKIAQQTDNLMIRFTEKLYSSGTVSQHLLKLGGHSKDHRDGKISKASFLKGISMSRDMRDADLDHIYYGEADAKRIANVLFVDVVDTGHDGSPVMDFAEMASKLSKFNLKSGYSHGSNC